MDWAHWLDSKDINGSHFRFNLIDRFIEHASVRRLSLSLAIVAEL